MNAPDVRVFESSEGNVWKYVFNFGDAIAEAVLYRHEDFYKRTVICCSVQSGCPVGCVFCGTGKRFVRNLTVEEILFQIAHILQDKDIEEVNSRSERFQIMFMSMGEPFLNMANTHDAVSKLHQKYGNAELLVSTVGVDFADPWILFTRLSKAIPKIGLQFSLHSGFESERDKIIPFKNKFSTLRRLRDAGIAWAKATGRKVFLNYCVTDTNASDAEVERIMDLFTPEHFNFTFSVVCSADETAKTAGCRNYSKIDALMAKFLEAGYNVRKFDPAGQDDIGGGCGQLFHVQNWLKEHGR